MGVMRQWYSPNVPSAPLNLPNPLHLGGAMRLVLTNEMWAEMVKSPRANPQALPHCHQPFPDGETPMGQSTILPPCTHSGNVSWMKPVLCRIKSLRLQGSIVMPQNLANQDKYTGRPEDMLWQSYTEEFSFDLAVLGFKQWCVKLAQASFESWLCSSFPTSAFGDVTLVINL